MGNYANMSGLALSSGSSFSDNASSAEREIEPLEWGFSSGSSLVICILSIFLNGLTLFVFLKDHALRVQPFNVYLIFLLICNLFLAIVQNPIEILNHRYPFWWMGHGGCVVYVYMNSFIGPAGMHAHVLISASRLWAMTFPHSYRRFHTRKMALFLCVCMFIYVHVVHLPDYIPQMINLKHPLKTYGCLSQYSVNISVQFLFYVCPILVIMTSYPIILHKHWQRRRMRDLRVLPVTYSAKVHDGQGDNYKLCT